MNAYLVVKNWIQQGHNKYNQVVNAYENENEALEEARILNETAESGTWFSVVKIEENE